MTTFEGISGKQLQQTIDKIEALEKEKQEISDTIKDAYMEAKGFGFEVKVIKDIIKNRKMDKEKLEEHEELMTLYMNALQNAQ